MNTRPVSTASRPAGNVRTARGAVQIGGFVRKEIVSVLRQPRLVLVLVIGPFLILMLFGIGYNQQQSVLRTAFVGPEGSIYEDSIDKFADSLQRYVINAGYSDDLVGAEQRLRNGDIDAVVVFPADPVEKVLAGEQATITLLHDKIDPIQQIAVEVSAQVAVMELNAQVLEAALTRAQEEFVPIADSIDAATAQLDALSAAVDTADAEQVTEILGELDRSSTAIDTVAQASADVADALGGDEETTGPLVDLEQSARTLSDTVDDLAARDGTITDDDLQTLVEQVDEVASIADTAATIDPAVVVRPFASDTANLQREPVTVNDFFAPAAVALLLQHMVLTFASMSLVTDRTLGLFEVFRVGPVNATRVMLGKYVSFMLIGSVVAAALLAAMVYLLDVPMRGDIVWVVVGVLGLLLASVGFGMMLSLLAKTDVQAVQFAMLALLAALFFGGFFLDLDAFRYPVKLLSWLLPVSYGIRLLRDVMLSGVDPSVYDLIGLGATSVGFALATWYLLNRQLRVR